MLIFFVFVAFIANAFMKKVEVIYKKDNIFLSQKKICKIEFKSNLEFIELKIRSNSTFLHIFNGILDLKPKSWGRIKVQDLEVSSEYPFYLFRTWKYLSLEGDIYVLPFLERESHFSDFEGSPEIRSFVSGDKISRINWKKSLDDKIFINYDEMIKGIASIESQLTIDLEELSMLSGKNEIKDVLSHINFYRENNLFVKNIKNEILSNQALDKLYVELLNRVDYEF